MRARIEVYFTPEAKFERLVTKHIKKAKGSIYVAMYSFTHPDLSRAIYLKSKKGVDCKVVLDRYTANDVSEVDELLEYGIKVHTSTGWGKMHHKFCVIDSKHTLCGSANWSKVADVRNSEDYLFISSKKLAQIFEARFKLLWNERSIPYRP